MNGRNLLVWGFVLVFLIFALQLFDMQSTGETAEELSYSQVNARVKSGEVASVVIDGGKLEGELTNGKKFISAIDENNVEPIANRFDEAGVQVEIKPEEELPILLSLLVNMLPLLIFFAFIFFIMR
ncbi:MAG: ATP-dependent metallopeptidase FtsH/Yme1/Tma family protein, partial [Pseudomonadota bacterium]